ncbi:MAG TPA: calcium-translocating P-type ATPase, PMCA-type [Candidatus Limadaptatus stercorigallinarum]|uniref:P-type Ca(2+) transporter n=1 Tax=Candidatus Limadaptatus stercorigallinarum TaxID=2840845 RepID=A0A9D1L1M9_9FIRM|nr:calcium-translocating P-type ATPase, PMCA-type [Candidatus Limadaptatus stercorigallinarum]
METFQDKSDDVKAGVEAVAATETSAEAGGTFHDKSAEEVLRSLSATEEGLTTAEADKRIAQYGKNALKEAKKKSLLRKFLEQFKDVMIIVLIVAAIVSAVIALVQQEYSELIDAGVILLIVIINAIIGVVQENKAETAMEALKNMNKSFSKVLRDGEWKHLASEEIVPGDVVKLEAGDIVPADMRLLTSASLKIEEAALTGESVPAEKDAEKAVAADAPLGDRADMAYSSGVVSYGRGTGVVTHTGMNTEVGKIATMLTDGSQQTSPLQKQLGKTAKLLSILVLAIAAIIFIVQAVRGNDIMDSFMTAVAIAVAAIPEGLPAVVTIVLAIGVQRMSKRNAIVKNLPSVETLGCCEVICSDKTGTLTLNQMTVKGYYLPDCGFKAVDEERASAGGDFDVFVRAMALCNDTEKTSEGLTGDPTETALVAYAEDCGYDFHALREDYVRVDEVPFDSVRKLMTTVNEHGGEREAYVKGAPDMLLPLCTRIMDGDTVRDITEKDVAAIKKANSQMAKKALRVLGVAVKTDGLDHGHLESNLVFVGLVGMIDPPRAEVKDAVRVCVEAGMRPIMITGDHIDTASAIASEIGILREGDKVILGADLDRMSDEEFKNTIEQYSVFARVSPENKVRIVTTYQGKGKVVAMTGDGVNDAPSIKRADIGIGMGITGTDVSKGAADLVLADDNFATIIGAVEEGRKIFSNIKKAIQFLLSANIAEVLCLFIATVILDIPFLTPIMILWINLVTDSFPALSLGMEEAERDVMKKPPRKSSSSLFAGRTGVDILVQGFMQTALVMTAFCIGCYVIPGGMAERHDEAMTMAFVSLALIQLFHAYSMRSQDNSILNKKLFANKYINLSFLIGVALTVLVVVVPPFRTVFETAMLNGMEWGVSIAVAFAIIPLVEIYKLVVRLIRKHNEKKAAAAVAAE